MLQAQDEAINEIVESVKERLKQVRSASSYQETLQTLMLQSFYRFMDGGDKELVIAIQVLQVDRDLAREALSGAVQSFKNATGHPIKAAIDEQNWLDPQSCLGGIVASMQKGKISVSNTLDSRLDLAIEALLPVIRTELFGPSDTRKFFD